MPGMELDHTLYKGSPFSTCPAQIHLANRIQMHDPPSPTTKYNWKKGGNTNKQSMMKTFNARV